MIGTATSSYTLELINYRLDSLRAMGEMVDADQEAERQRELAYLVDLKARKFPCEIDYVPAAKAA